MSHSSLGFVTSRLHTENCENIKELKIEGVAGRIRSFGKMSEIYYTAKMSLSNPPEPFIWSDGCIIGLFHNGNWEWWWDMVCKEVTQKGNHRNQRRSCHTEGRGPVGHEIHSDSHPMATWLRCLSCHTQRPNCKLICDKTRAGLFLEILAFHKLVYLHLLFNKGLPVGHHSSVQLKISLFTV